RSVHEDSLARAVVDQSVVHQALQCFAHRVAAHAQLAGEVVFAQVGTGRERPADDSRLERLIDALAQELRSRQDSQRPRTNLFLSDSGTHDASPLCENMTPALLPAHGIAAPTRAGARLEPAAVAGDSGGVPLSPAATDDDAVSA